MMDISQEDEKDLCNSPMFIELEVLPSFMLYRVIERIRLSLQDAALRQACSSAARPRLSNSHPQKARTASSASGPRRKRRTKE